MNETAPPPPPQVVLLQMFMGMWHAQIISAIAQLGVPDKLAGGAASAGDLARGRERTAGEYTALLRRNGWAVEEVIPTGGMFSVIEAVKI